MDWSILALDNTDAWTVVFIVFSHRHLQGELFRGYQELFCDLELWLLIYRDVAFPKAEAFVEEIFTNSPESFLQPDALWRTAFPWSFFPEGVKQEEFELQPAEESLSGANVELAKANGGNAHEGKSLG